MRFRTRRGWCAAALAGSALVASLAAGAVPAVAGTRAPAATVTWHRIFAINNWHSGQSTYGTGDPSWAVSNGVVYLSGSVIGTGASSNLFGVLPPEARPSHALWLTVYTLAGTTGTLAIKTNGKMYAFSTPPASSHGFTSLATVSFPAKSTKVTKFPLRNGWFSEQGAFNSGDPSSTVRNGVVYLSGSLATNGGSDLFAVLPKAARPAHVLYLTVYTFGGTFGTLQINPSGVARAYAGSATSFTSLAGVSYPAASASSTTLRLRNGWVSEQSQFNSGDPASAVRNGVVSLSGSLATAGANELFGVLPTAARPTHTLFIKVYTFGSTVGTLEIEPSGDMFAFSPNAADAEDFTSLAGVSFPLKS